MQSDPINSAAHKTTSLSNLDLMSVNAVCNTIFLLVFHLVWKLRKLFRDYHPAFSLTVNESAHASRAVPKPDSDKRGIRQPQFYFLNAEAGPCMMFWLKWRLGGTIY